LQHARTVRECDLGRPVRRAVDDQDLTGDAGLLEPLAAPVDKLSDRQLLVQSGDDDRDLRVRDVVDRHQQSQVAGFARCGAVTISYSSRATADS